MKRGKNYEFLSLWLLELFVWKKYPLFYFKFMPISPCNFPNISGKKLINKSINYIKNINYFS